MSEGRGRESGRRAIGVTAVAIAVVAGIGVTLYATLLTLFHCTDGDGGVPYVARSSTQADVCGAGQDGFLVLLIAVGAVIGLGVLATRAWGEWRERSGPVLAALALTVAVAAAPLLAFAAFHMPSDDCSDQQRAEVDAWERAGRGGDPPHDCDSY